MKTQREIADELADAASEEVHGGRNVPLSSIYMIAYVSRDEDNYRDETLAPEQGFFLTEEDAQAWVDDRHNFKEGYEKHLRSVEESNARMQKEFEVKTRVWDEMKAEGVEPGFFKPAKAYVTEPPTYEQFVQNNETYCVIEVERADHG